MKKATLQVGVDSDYSRTIDLGPLKYLIDKCRGEDMEYVVYKLSYAGRYIVIKGKTLVGSLVILADTLASFNPGASRFKDHLYTHLYNHILECPGGRFRLKIMSTASTDQDFYDLLKTEQNLLDAAKYDTSCLNNQIEAYIPLYNENTRMYGWIPRAAVMNFRKYLRSAERKALLRQYKK